MTPPLSEETQSVDYVEIVHEAAKKPAHEQVKFERNMGDTELSYFLPSRQSGVNDMYLHLGFSAPDHVVSRSRVRTVWAILRMRHPLLAAHAEMHDYDDVRFVYTVPRSTNELLSNADANLEYRTQGKDELIESYLNGPRTLSNTRLSYLILSQSSAPHSPLTPPRTPSPVSDVSGSSDISDESTTELQSQFELLICAMHFLGDGMALHAFANDFFGLLGSDKTDLELELILSEEWHTRWGSSTNNAAILPSTLEDNIPLEWSRLRSVAADVDFQMSQQKLVGGQTFPRRKHPERHTIVPTVSFPEDRTKAILKKCKANGVSISAALFAICNVAWARVGCGSGEVPSLMYSALNLRPYFTVQKDPLWNSYWYLAIGYFNVILPNFLPSEKEKVVSTFWHRARQAKEQSTKAAKNPLIVSRTHKMSKERGERARAWAREDDEKEKGTWVPPTPKPVDTTQQREPVLPARAKASSAALMGLSLLGNLDGIYKHATFPSVKMHTLTTGSRQRNGAMLLFGYTFAGKLWISLGYDKNGFQEGIVDKFWDETLHCVDEFLG
ncbi:hypothetical protein C8Q75DRAFT_723299 [Abortiporus biennis]|nr:hypothetical protein C8Q75DRAFT_723299 [Abortiporus biennis]